MWLLDGVAGVIDTRNDWFDLFAWIGKFAVMYMSIGFFVFLWMSHYYMNIRRPNDYYGTPWKEARVMSEAKERGWGWPVFLIYVMVSTIFNGLTAAHEAVANRWQNIIAPKPILAAKVVPPEYPDKYLQAAQVEVERVLEGPWDALEEREAQR